MPHVSVVIPAFNSGNFIRQSICSVLAQSFKDYEVIVIDDGSTDSTAEVVEAILEKDSRLRLFRTENRGVALARNLGIDRAKGDWVAFLDADDWWEPLKLERQLEFAKAHPEIAIASTYGRYVNQQGDSLGFLNIGPVSQAELEAIRNDRSPISMLTPGIICKREVLLAAGKFNPDFQGAAEDMDLWTRIGYRHPALTLPEQLVNVGIQREGASLQKWHLIQKHILWIKLNLERDKQNQPPMSREQFTSWLNMVDAQKKAQWFREWESNFYYRRAGAAFLEKKIFSGLADLARSFFMKPDGAVKKVIKHLGRRKYLYSGSPAPHGR